jgi:hypothetical protein
MIWKTRAKIKESSIASFKRYEAKDGPYAVTEITGEFDGVVRWIAIRVTERGEEIVSRHRKKGKAQEACENDERTRSSRG